MKKATKSKRGGFRPGAGRKPLVDGEPSVTFSGKVPASLAAQVDARLGDMGRGELLRRLLEKWVRKHK